MAVSPPFNTVRSPRHMVASADRLATQAGLRALTLGGNAVDAAIAANAALAVTGPHLCGMGGDLFALVHVGGTVHCLNASGRAGSGASAAILRAEGRDTMPFRHDIRAVTVPGCVDGWSELHRRFARLPLDVLLQPALDLAEHGFPASPLLVGAVASLDARSREALAELASQARRPGSRVRRPGVAAALRAVAAGGRDAFYLGDFGMGLREMGADWFSEADLAAPGANWVEPLAVDVFGIRLHTVPPNSQGYLALGGALLASALAAEGTLPGDPDDERWAHLLVEAAKAAGRDRPEVLHEGADGAALLQSIAGRRSLIGESAAALGRRVAPGDTTYLCTVDDEGNGVSLIQSNAAGFGSHLVERRTGINLHNRGLGFSIEAGHAAEIRPGARPPHTLSPLLATRGDDLAAVLGTMGGDAQPQILLQVLTRLYVHGRSPAEAIYAGRWALQGPVTGFDTWTSDDGPVLTIEGHAPADWAPALAARGHRVEARPAYDDEFGHAHAIVRDDEGFWAGAADPRARVALAGGG
ncbi:MAG: gamma-glutamyltransferase family protein [Ilumatobacteraceae bacterium]